jgi:hypothetical protein
MAMQCASHVIELLAGFFFVGAVITRIVMACTKAEDARLDWSIGFAALGSGLWVWSTDMMMRDNGCYGE